MANLKEILEERGKTHGDFSHVADMAQELKDTFRDGVNWATDEMHNVHYEALDMIASKIACILCGNPQEPDHWRDIAGYATLVAREMEELQRVRGV